MELRSSRWSSWNGDSPPKGQARPPPPPPSRRSRHRLYLLSIRFAGARPGRRTLAMHDIKWIRDNPGAFDHALKRRGLPPQANDLVALDERRREAIQKVEAAQARR